MATAKKTVTSSWAAVAQGPGSVVFSFLDEYGSFTIHGASDPSGITSGHKQPPETPFTVTLLTGEFLHLRGRGSASVSAANPV